MRDFRGRNWRTMGSFRGSCQLTRLRMYGLSRVSNAFAVFRFKGPSRHPNSHGGCRYAIENILDELGPSLHPRDRLVIRDLFWENSLQEVVQLGLGLHQLGGLGLVRNKSNFGYLDEEIRTLQLYERNSLAETSLHTGTLRQNSSWFCGRAEATGRAVIRGVGSWTGLV